MSDCVFCRIVAGEIPSHRFYEDEHVLGFLDIGPLSEGHALVIPKQHHATLDQLSPELGSALGRVLPRIGKAVQAVSAADGFNVLQNNGAVAGQAVGHVHFHIIPRCEGDGLGYRWRPGTYPEGRAAALTEQLAAALD